MKTLKSPIFDIDQIVNSTYLYYLGDDNTELTGGWEKYTRSSTAANRHQFVETETSLIDRMTGAPGGTSSWWGAIITKNLIDAREYVGIGFGCEQGTNVGYNWNFKLLTSSKGDYKSETCLDVSTKNVKKIRWSDLISGENNIYVGFGGRGADYQTNDFIAYAFALTKQDDISVISDYGSTVSEIITNANSLLSNLNAVKAMVKNCTGDFMWQALSNDSFVSSLNASSNKNIVLGNQEWGKALQLIL